MSSSQNLSATPQYAGRARVDTFVTLSVVGTERIPESTPSQKRPGSLIKEGESYSIVHATQFFDFIKPSPMTPRGTDGSVPLALIQPGG